MSNEHDGWPDHLPRTLLIGAGVVGQAIAREHVRRGIPICLADQSERHLNEFVTPLKDDSISFRFDQTNVLGMPMVCVDGEQPPPEEASLMVIESIVEKLEAKQQLFASLQRAFGTSILLCSNTSTLRIGDIADGEQIAPANVFGVHFFMPVHQRAAAEVVAGSSSDAKGLRHIDAHLRLLGKRAIHCGDGPGFIVNRMLCPYLNQALHLLCRGVAAETIERAAIAFGMPISPLELIDWIGASTMYHAGRAYWQAFPDRFDPSPLAPALIKSGRLGRQSGKGFYDYQGGVRSPQLAADIGPLLARYHTECEPISPADVLYLLFIPMWHEACRLVDEGIAESMETVDLAMAGGLGYVGNESWSQFFVQLGEPQMEAAAKRWKSTFRSMNP